MVQVVPPPDWTPGDDGEIAADGSSIGGSSIGAGTESGAVQPASSSISSVAGKTAAPKTAPPKLPQAVAASIVAAGSGILAVPASAKRQVVKTPATSPAAVPPIPARTAATPPVPVQSLAELVRAAPIAPIQPTEVVAASSRWFWPTFGAATFLALAVAGLVIYLDRHNNVSADAVTQAAASTPTVTQVAPQPNTTVGDKSPTPPAPVVAPPAAVQPPTATQPSAVPPLAVSRVTPPKVDPASRATLAPAAPAPIAPKPPIAVQPPKQDDIFAPPAAVAATPAAPQAAARPSLQRIPPRNIDVDARLADRLAGVEFQQSPLWQFLSDLSQLSTVPISLDIDALSEMNLSADMPISVQLKNTTLAGILDESLVGRGLAWRTVGRQIEIGRAPAQELRRVRYSVADLAGDQPESRRQFAALVHSLVSPNGWSEANGSATSEWSEGSLVVTADASAHAQLLVLCEKLRLARGVPLKSRIDPARFHLDTRAAHAKTALDAPITVNFARPEALEKIVAYLRSTTRMNLLVDNIALAEDGMSGESEGVLIAQKQTLDSALGSLLDPMELAYRVIDERTIEITTPKAAARHAEVEFYPAGDLLAAGSDGHELVTRLTRELNAAISAGPVLSSPSIQFDAPSKYLIVRAPQSLQHRVESLLGTMRVARQ